MAKLDNLPHQTIIDGFKGLLDFYYWKGIPVARKWPDKAIQPGTPIQRATWEAFAYINKLWRALPPAITAFYSEHARLTTQTGKDYLNIAYLGRILEIMPPEYYATQATLEALRVLVAAMADFATQTTLSQLLTELQLKADLTETQPISAAALPLPALAATAANQVLIDARLDAIQVTRGAVVAGTRSGIVASGAAWTDVINVSLKGLLIAVSLSTDYLHTQLNIALDGVGFQSVNWDGTAVSYPSPSIVHQNGGEDSLFKQGLYNDTDDHYAFHLKRPIEFDTALEVRVRQTSGVNKNIAVTAYYQPLT